MPVASENFLAAASSQADEGPSAPATHLIDWPLRAVRRAFGTTMVLPAVPAGAAVGAAPAGAAVGAAAAVASGAAVGAAAGAAVGASAGAAAGAGADVGACVVPP